MAQGQQSPAIHAETDNRDEFRTLAVVVAASDIIGPDGVFPRSQNSATLDALQRLVTTGEAGDYAATLLALRQIPFASPKGDDNVREMSARIMQTALTTTDPTIRTIAFCPQSGSCNMKPITRPEIRLATGAGQGEPALPDMLPNRALPITRSGAAITGFLDAQMNTNRYLGVSPSGEVLSLPETVAAMQTRNPPAVTNETLASCLANENTYSIAQCAIAGARAGVAFNNESGVRYNGAKFLGFAQPTGQHR